MTKKPRIEAYNPLHKINLAKSIELELLTSATQPPHELPALVADFNAPMLVAPAQTAAQIWPFDTLLHEQICAASGNAS